MRSFTAVAQSIVDHQEQQTTSLANFTSTCINYHINSSNNSINSSNNSNNITQAFQITSTEAASFFLYLCQELFPLHDNPSCPDYKDNNSTTIATTGANITTVTSNITFASLSDEIQIEFMTLICAVDTETGQSEVDCILEMLDKVKFDQEVSYQIELTIPEDQFSTNTTTMDYYFHPQVYHDFESYCTNIYSISTSFHYGSIGPTTPPSMSPSMSQPPTIAKVIHEYKTEFTFMIAVTNEQLQMDLVSEEDNIGNDIDMEQLLLNATLKELNSSQLESLYDAFNIQVVHIFKHASNCLVEMEEEEYCVIFVSQVLVYAHEIHDNDSISGYIHDIMSASMKNGMLNEKIFDKNENDIQKIIYVSDGNDGYSEEGLLLIGNEIGVGGGHVSVTVIVSTFVGLILLVCIKQYCKPDSVTTSTKNNNHVDDEENSMTESKAQDQSNNYVENNKKLHLKGSFQIGSKRELLIDDDGDS
jgi:hypothetical protein